MQAIIFDCDGTLVDSELLSNEVLVETVAEHGLVLSHADQGRAGHERLVAVDDQKPPMNLDDLEERIDFLECRLEELLSCEMRPRDLQ